MEAGWPLNWAEAVVVATSSGGGGGSGSFPPTPGSVPLASPAHWQISEAFQLSRLANRLEGAGNTGNQIALTHSLSRIKLLYPQLDARPFRGNQQIYSDLINILTGENISSLFSSEYLLGVLHASLDAYEAGG